MSHSLPIAFVLFAMIVTAEAGHADFALSGLYGRMMRRCAMQKRISPEVKNGLDNAGNRQPNQYAGPAEHPENNPKTQ